MGEHELRRPRDRIADPNRSERDRNIDAKQESQNRNQHHMDGQRNEGDQETERERASDVVSMHAPIRRVFQEPFEWPHQPIGFDALALSGEALEKASKHGGRRLETVTADSYLSIIQVPQLCG